MITSKYESVADLRVVWAHAVRVQKTLTLEEARIERSMKGNCKGRQSLLAHFPQEHNFQQQQKLLPIKSNYLSQHQQQLAIHQQPPLPLYNDANIGSLFWSSQSQAEVRITCYTNPGENNNSDDIRMVFAPDGVYFVENNGRQILNKWNVSVRRGEKCLLYPFSKYDPQYLSNFPLNFNGCFICGSTTHRDKIFVP